jgi:hypothetical protein
MTLMEEPAIIGFNLFTVETGLGVAALLLMMQTLYRAK